MSKRTILLTMCLASALAVPPFTAAYARAQFPTDNVTLTGRVSCSKCEGVQPTHKGYTNWTWALHSVSEGDDIVFIVGKTTYKLQGDPEKLLKYIASKATVTGQLEGATLKVETIKSPSKGK